MSDPIAPTVATPPGNETHESIRLKLNETLGFTITSVIPVYSEDNYPSEDGGSHPLEDGVVYVLSADVAMTYPLNFGDASINTAVICLGTATGSMTYLGTDPFIISSGGKVETRLIEVVHPNSDLYDINGAQDIVIKAPECTFIGNGGGAAGGVLIADFEKATFVFATNPLQIDGTNIVLLIKESAFFATEVTSLGCLDLLSGTFVDVRLSNTQFNYNSTGYGIRSQVNGGNITGEAILAGCIFNGTGTPLDGITSADPEWEIKGNTPRTDVPDSKILGSSYVATAGQQTTNVNVQNSLFVIAGTYIVVDESQVTTSQSGRITNTSGKTLTFDVKFKGLATPTSGTNKNYEFWIGISGVNQPQTKTPINADSSNPQSFNCFGSFEIEPNQYFEPLVSSPDASPQAFVGSGVQFEALGR